MSKEQAIEHITALIEEGKKQPFQLRLLGPANIVLAAAGVHIRNGYHFYSDAPFQVLGNGFLDFYLVKGNPDANAINQAQADIEQAAALEEQERKRQIREEARLLVEAEKRAELEKQKKAIEAEHAKKIAQLEKDTQAIIAALNK